MSLVIHCVMAHAFFGQLRAKQAGGELSVKVSTPQEGVDDGPV